MPTPSSRSGWDLKKLDWVHADVPGLTVLQWNAGHRGWGCGVKTQGAKSRPPARWPQAAAARQAEAARQAAVAKAQKEAAEKVRLLGVVFVHVFTCFVETV